MAILMAQRTLALTLDINSELHPYGDPHGPKNSCSDPYIKGLSGFLCNMLNKLERVSIREKTFGSKNWTEISSLLSL